MRSSGNISGQGLRAAFPSVAIADHVGFFIAVLNLPLLQSLPRATSLTIALPCPAYRPPWSRNRAFHQRIHSVQSTHGLISRAMNATKMVAMIPERLMIGLGAKTHGKGLKFQAIDGRAISLGKGGGDCGGARSGDGSTMVPRPGPVRGAVCLLFSCHSAKRRCVRLALDDGRNSHQHGCRFTVFHPAVHEVSGLRSGSGFAVPDFVFHHRVFRGDVSPGHRGRRSAGRRPAPLQ